MLFREMQALQPQRNSASQRGNVVSVLTKREQTREIDLQHFAGQQNCGKQCD
jgi:hypothetical protein